MTLALLPLHPHCHTLPHPCATSSELCFGSSDGCCLQPAGSWRLASTHTRAVQTGTAHQIISHPKVQESRHPNSGTPVAGCASTTPGKRSRAGLRVSACKVLALANKLPQVKPSIQRQLAHGNQLPDQTLLNLAQQTVRQDPAGSSMALGARWVVRAQKPPQWAMSLSYLQTLMP